MHTSVHNTRPPTRVPLAFANKQGVPLAFANEQGVPLAFANEQGMPLALANEQGVDSRRRHFGSGKGFIVNHTVLKKGFR